MGKGINSLVSKTFPDQVICIVISNRINKFDNNMESPILTWFKKLKTIFRSPVLSQVGVANRHRRHQRQSRRIPQERHLGRGKRRHCQGEAFEYNPVLHVHDIPWQSDVSCKSQPFKRLCFVGCQTN
ncbi:hypothetical protein TNIN_363211 [Trichonephila inaurata madagascariensis]|uniref:Uncharacterized protein n=1 Tax=Trichonephila inaurata madagascariensis TaxID=2747483 RepID=A0A8X6JQG9_9ARAC|nr:hypothetical protein TNIN_363211 [Trichonephila inaurata madagascariensis]